MLCFTENVWKAKLNVGLCRSSYRSMTLSLLARVRFMNTSKIFNLKKTSAHNWKVQYFFHKTMTTLSTARNIQHPFYLMHQLNWPDIDLINFKMLHLNFVRDSLTNANTENWPLCLNVMTISTTYIKYCHCSLQKALFN